MRQREMIMGRRGGPIRAASHIGLFVAWVVVLLRVLAVEASPRPDPRAFQRYEPPGGLLPSQEEYVDWAGNHIAWMIRGAKVCSVRFKVVALVSGMSALAITLAVAVHAPTWVSAVLGFIAAAGQFAQGLNRDREHSQLAHQAAVRLQRVLRDFHTDAGELSGQRLRERFKEFKQAFEGIKDEYGVEAFKVRSQDPPQIGDGSR